MELVLKHETGMFALGIMRPFNNTQWLEYGFLWNLCRNIILMDRWEGRNNQARVLRWGPCDMINPSTREAEAGGFLSLRLAWSTEWVPGQPELHREALSWKTKTNKRTKHLKKFKKKKISLTKIWPFPFSLYFRISFKNGIVLTLTEIWTVSRAIINNHIICSWRRISF